MMIFSKRVIALVIKELLTLLRDPKNRLVLVGPPLLQLMLFSFAATLDVKNINVVVLNQDAGRHSKEIIQSISASKSFKQIFNVKNFAKMKELIDQQKVIVAIHFQKNFSQKIDSGHKSTIQVILDGRRANAAQIVNGYIISIIDSYTRLLGNRKNVEIINRNWFNPNLLYLWSNIPALVCILSMVISLVITSLSIARERELGTLDQILVSPLSPYEILIGKTIPAVVIGFVEGLLIWLVGITIFQVPFQGSLILLSCSILIFIISIVGIGLFISSFAKTQQQAILGSFIFMVPAISLSGYASPIENMPEWLESIIWINPLKHALILVKGIFLKNISLTEVLSHVWPLLIIASITLSIALYTLIKRLE